VPNVTRKAEANRAGQSSERRQAISPATTSAPSAGSGQVWSSERCPGQVAGPGNPHHDDRDTRQDYVLEHEEHRIGGGPKGSIQASHTLIDA
jgi:hypothetical protein